MIKSLQTTKQLYLYGHELVDDRKAFGCILQDVTDVSGVNQILAAQSLAGVSAMGLLSKQAYDMALDREDRDPMNRWQAALLGGLTLLATDLVDDEIDRREMPLEEKFRYLDAWSRSLLSGAAELGRTNYPAGGNADAVRVSFELAIYISQLLHKHDGLGKFVTVLDPLVEAVKLQMTSESVDEQLELTASVGEGCGIIGAAAVEVVEKTDFPVMTQAQVALGCYAECVNHAYEIDGNLAEGSQSYSNVYLRVFGDTAANRQFVKQALLQLGSDRLSQGIEALNPDQLRIMMVGKTMIDLKYRVLGKLAKPLKK